MNRRSLKLIALGVLVLTAAVFLFFSFYQPFVGTEVDFLNVGQGDSILIKTPYNQFVLIDGGPDRSVLSRLGEQLPWFKRDLDLLIISHPHDDHLGGLTYLAKIYNFDRVAMTNATATSPAFQTWLKIMAEKKIVPARLATGQIINLGPDCYLEIEAADIAKADNDSSAIIKYVYKNFSVLLTGDIDEAAENTLIKNRGAKLKSVILKIPHHGSDTASIPAFLAEVNPQAAVISVGKNDYGHPSPRVLNRLERAGIKFWRTDWTGTVRIESDGINWNIR